MEETSELMEETSEFGTRRQTSRISSISADMHATNA